MNLWVGLALGSLGVMTLYGLLRSDRQHDEVLHALTHGARIQTLQRRSRFKNRKGRSAKRRLDRVRVLVRTANGPRSRSWVWAREQRAPSRRPLEAEVGMMQLPWWLGGGRWPDRPSVLVSGPPLDEIARTELWAYVRWSLAWSLIIMTGQRYASAGVV